MNVARLTARVLIGGLFIGHGTQKLKGWFGGPGLDGTRGMMDQLDLHPPKRNAIAAGTTETAGGALLAAGLATPVACASLMGTMITAIQKVHLGKGPWNTEGGWEYNLVLIAALLALAEEGPGDVSLDAALGVEKTGFRWAAAALTTAAAASALTVVLGRKEAEQAKRAPEQPA